MKVKMFDKEWEVKNPTYKEKRDLQRARMSAINATGKVDTEKFYDALEIVELLKDPQVLRDLGQVKGGSGFWNRVKGMTKNEIRQWLVKKGVAPDNKTTEFVVRMSKMSSTDRHELLGSAMTSTELSFVKDWIIDPGDSLDTTIAKVKVIAAESKERFRHVLDSYKDRCDMSPYYEAYGLDRFETQGNADYSGMSDEELLKKISKEWD